MTEYIRHPALAPEFQWGPRTQYDRADTALTLHGELLVSLIDKVDGGWFARLHRFDGVDEPIITRQCTSFEGGRMGAELWVMRHENELREKVARKLKWIREHVAQHPASRR